MYLNVNLSPPSWSPKWPFFKSCPHQSSVNIYYLPMSSPLQQSCFYNPNNGKEGFMLPTLIFTYTNSTQLITWNSCFDSSMSCTSETENCLLHDSFLFSYLLMTTGLFSLDNLGARALHVVAILIISALQSAVIPWRASAEESPCSSLLHWFRIWDNNFTSSGPCCSGLNKVNKFSVILFFVLSLLCHI